MKHLIENNKIVKSGIPRNFTRPNGEAFWGGYQNMTALHDADGWVGEITPAFDSVTHHLGERYYDIDLGKVTYSLIEIEHDLEELKAKHKKDMLIAIREISQLASDIKNVYDPLRINPDNIPEDFKALAQQIILLHQQGYAEIEALSTPVEALNYVVAGPIVKSFIEQLKSFL